MEKSLKQYLICIEQEDLPTLSKVFPSFKFFEVSGLNLTEHPEFQVLITPKKVETKEIAQDLQVIDAISEPCESGECCQGTCE